MSFLEFWPQLPRNTNRCHLSWWKNKDFYCNKRHRKQTHTFRGNGNIKKLLRLTNDLTKYHLLRDVLLLKHRYITGWRAIPTSFIQQTPQTNTNESYGGSNSLDHCRLTLWPWPRHLLSSIESQLLVHLLKYCVIRDKQWNMLNLSVVSQLFMNHKDTGPHQFKKHSNACNVNKLARQTCTGVCNEAQKEERRDHSKGVIFIQTKRSQYRHFL